MPSLSSTGRDFHTGCGTREGTARDFITALYTDFNSRRTQVSGVPWIDELIDSVALWVSRKCRQSQWQYERLRPSDIYICIYTFVDLTRFSYLCDPSASSGVNKRDGKEEGGEKCEK